MPFEYYIRSGKKQLRCGYTTGACAALAAGAAAQLLLTGQPPPTARLMTPKGLWVEAPIEEAVLDGHAARCGVRKDAGDDADVTDGLLISATVRKKDAPGIVITGGEGVGVVTKPGLDQPVGEKAINRAPRTMIAQAVQAVCGEWAYDGGLQVEISVPLGRSVAAKTFNPALGIQGGISILGTSGIVEPMSERAIVDTIALEIRQRRAQGASCLLLTPGNYGLTFLKNHGWEPDNIPLVKCSNFLGEALDIAATEGFRAVLLVGHVGKLVKLAGGLLNTHSKWGDCRTELICAHAAAQGASTALCRSLLDAATTDSCLALLDQENLRKGTLDSLLAAIQRQLDKRAGGAFSVGAVLFSNVYGYLGETETVDDIKRSWV